MGLSAVGTLGTLPVENRAFILIIIIIVTRDRHEPIILAASVCIGVVILVQGYLLLVLKQLWCHYLLRLEGREKLLTWRDVYFSDTDWCCAFQNQLVVHGAVWASCLVSHRLVIICIDVTHPLGVKVAPLLQDLLQINVIISCSLG